MPRQAKNTNLAEELIKLSAKGAADKIQARAKRVKDIADRATRNFRDFSKDAAEDGRRGVHIAFADYYDLDHPLDPEILEGWTEAAARLVNMNIEARIEKEAKALYGTSYYLVARW